MSGEGRVGTDSKKEVRAVPSEREKEKNSEGAPTYMNLKVLTRP